MRKCDFCCTKLEHVCVKRGQEKILEDITMHIHCNEITALIGPNGAGKTTLVKTILGEIPYEGTLKYVTHEDRKQKFQPVMGYVPQYLNFDRNTPLSVIDLFACCTQKTPVWLGIEKKFRRQVEERLEEVDMNYAIDRKIGALSGGEFQRVLVAIALMPTPDILLLDEPISGVDMQGKRVFYEIINQLKAQHHMAIILITHDIPILDQICDQAVLLNKRILAKGTPQELFKHPAMEENFGVIFK